MATENDTNATATDDSSTQDVVSRLEERLFPSEKEPKPADEVVSEDDENLPDDDDTDEDEEEGSDLKKIATDEELTLAGYLGIDDDRIIIGEDGAVLFEAIIDGEKKQVPLKELASSFQLQGHVNNKSIALEKDRKEFDEAKSKVIDELSSRVQGVSQLGALAEKELVSEFNSIDWDRLRVEDPGQYAAIRQEYAERAQKIQQLKALVAQEQGRVHKEQQEHFAKLAEDYSKEQFNKMLVDNPTWSDEAVRTKELSALKTFVLDYGFTEQELQGVNDHRLLRLIKDAYAYKSGKKAAEEKRVGKPLPKFQKTGLRKGNTESLNKARATKALRAKAKQTGSVQDVAAALVDRM